MIISWSPPFALSSTKNRRWLQKQNNMRLNVCVHKMAWFGPFAAIVKGEITFDSSSGGTKGGLSVHKTRDGQPTRYESAPR